MHCCIEITNVKKKHVLKIKPGADREEDEHGRVARGDKEAKEEIPSLQNRVGPF
jgi:hypothetical protein